MTLINRTKGCHEHKTYKNSGYTTDVKNNIGS